MKIVDDFVRHVKAAIERTGIEVTELAKKSGVSRGYIHRLLAGEQNPSLGVAARIAKPLGLAIETKQVPSEAKRRRA